MEKSLVSVIIPCYNHENYVADCLKSIINQTYPNLEIIICDDCSQDASMEEIQRQKILFEERNIRFVAMKNEKNSGVPATINRMLKEAKGEYIKPLASDDILMEDYISEMVAVLEEDASLKFAFCNCTRIKESSKYPVRKEDEIGVLFPKLPDLEGNIFERMYINYLIPAPTIIFRKSILDEVGGYDENIGIEDMEMSLRILNNYPKGVKSYEKVLVYYRLSDNSMTSTVDNAGAKKRMRFMHKNSVAIAKKYKSAVSSAAYWKRMVLLYLVYFKVSFVRILSVLKKRVVRCK